MAHFSAAQHAIIQRKSRPKEVDPTESGGELNIIPFLDIVMNVLMFVLASIATVFTATIPVPAPSSSRSGRPGAQAEGLNLTVQILQNGYVVGARGGFLAPGCREVASRGGTIAVPNLGQPDAEGRAHDFGGLTRCMQSIRQQFPQEVAGDDGHNINISVNAGIPYGVLVGTIDAVRESRPGACRLPEEGREGVYTDADCMFPRATLGVLQNR